MGKIAIICDGPYQLLSGLNVAYGLCENEEIDLFLLERVERQFPGILERLRGLRKFANVYSYAETWQRGVSVQRVIELMFPRVHLKKAKFSGPLEAIVGYSSIYMSTPMTMQKTVCVVNPHANVYWYDEGLGTYAFETVKNETTWVRRFFLSMIGRNIMRMEPKQIYLNNPTLYWGGKKNIVSRLPMNIIEDKHYRDRVMYLYQYPHSVKYDKCRLVLLAQPGYTKLMTSSLRALIDNFRDEIIVRKHPAEKEIRDVERDILDYGEDIWELICLDQITDNHVLMSMYSAAKFMPKLMYDKEPYVVFLYHLYRDYIAPIEYESMRKGTNKLKTLYRNKRKILVPNTHEELMAYLKGLFKNKNDKG